MLDQVEVPAIVKAEGFHSHAQGFGDGGSAGFTSVHFPKHSPLVLWFMKGLRDEVLSLGDSGGQCKLHGAKSMARQSAGVQLILEFILLGREHMLGSIEVRQIESTARHFLSDVQGKEALGWVSLPFHALSERHQVFAMSANQNRLPGRSAKAQHATTEVNAHVESFDDWATHQHRRVARYQVALDCAQLTINRHRQVDRPSSLG